MKRAFATSLLFLAAIAPVAEARVIEMGASPARQPTASCPDDCQAVGRVTGYQLRTADGSNPYRATRRGKIVAFTITLGQPRADQIEFFNDLFGGPAQVRLTILRPGSKRRHRLTGQSEVFDVSRYFGSSPTFALERPLTVKKDYVVAITAVTWAPAFAVNLTDRELWRSSRDPDKCDDVRQNAAQQVRGGLRTFGCVYRTARLLYTATFVPDPRPTVREESDSRESRRR